MFASEEPKEEIAQNIDLGVKLCGPRGILKVRGVTRVTRLRIIRFRNMWTYITSYMFLMISLPFAKLKAEQLGQLVKNMNDLGGKVSVETPCGIACA